MKVGVSNQSASGEARVALTPAVVKKLLKINLEVVVEAGAGRASSLIQAGTSVAEIDRERWVTVELTADIVGLPWQLERHRHKLRVRPGQATSVAYRVRNTSQTLVTGTAVPSVVPPRAARYFIKTACFCFEQQTLMANETRDMPLTFVVDPKLPAEIKTITLSYSFYPAIVVSS